MRTPYVDRTNIIARYKERKHGRNVLLFGQDTDADANSRSNARQMFDGDMLVHGDLLVRIRTWTIRSSSSGTDGLRRAHSTSHSRVWA